MRIPFFSRKARHVKSRDRWDLSTPLLQWSALDAWTIGDAVTGTLTVGATGSGKTSGSGRAMAVAMLRQGFGGLVLTAKPDERELWQRYAREAGREEDLRIFGSDASLRFNFLDYESRHRGEGAGLTENLVSFFSIVLEIADRGASGRGGREDEGYWRRASRQLIRNAVDLLTLARRPITVPDLYKS
jgi:hypothetical protein